MTHTEIMQQLALTSSPDAQTRKNAREAILAEWERLATEASATSAMLEGAQREIKELKGEDK